MLLIADGIKYKPYECKNEEELEGYVKECAKYIFGEESLYLEKKRISSLSGITSIPDGYAITFDPPQWYVVEVELSKHNVDDHIFPQLSRFIRGINNPTERRNLTEYIYDEVNRNRDINNKFRERYSDVYKCVSDIINKSPIILIIIDERTDKLDEAISSINAHIEIIEFKTFEREGIGIAVRAHLFEPVVKQAIIYGQSINKVTLNQTVSNKATPRREFTLPLLEVLIEIGGKGRLRDILARIEKKMEGKLTDKDKGRVESGGIRWRRNVQFLRIELRDKGCLKKDSPYGIWEITDEGRELYRQLKSSLLQA